ncbi:TRAP transporter large permease [Aminiphilus circumscriptus]|uniref:TRAP transporter large permease n=1 Tax=Aminiphilus circumscriptus TaxID=290732 RepID=UPI0004785BE5|nr:TRAP transporter large permease [Aminiphilus circumscriptus]
MDALVLSLLFVGFLVTSIPIGIAIGCAVLVFVLIYDVSGFSFMFQNMYSAINSFPLMAVPFFMLTGSIMEGGGLSQRIVNVANKLVGNRTSGLAIVAILACMFFGAISGSAPATLAAIGTIMVPAMVKHRYSKNFSVGVVTTAGGLGIIIPPSIPLVIYGVGTMTSIGDLFIAGIGPGVVVGVFLMITARIVGKKRGYTGTGERFSFREAGKAAWEAKWALFMPLIILGGIYGGIFTPTEAAVVGVVYGMFVGFFIYKELTIKRLMEVFVDNASLVGASFLIFGFATSLSFLVSVTMLPDRLSEAISMISTNKYVVLFIVNIFLILLGMLMDTMSANLIFSPLLLSIVAPLGVDPVHFGIVITIALALGFVTPPMATNLFLASTIFDIPVQEIIKEELPFVFAMILALFVVTFIPQISLFLVQFLH